MYSNFIDTCIHTGIWVYFCTFPVLILNTITPPPSLDLLSLLGGVVWLTGLTIETVADEQKRVFRSTKANHGRFIDTGLWAISRHPNCKLYLYMYTYTSLSLYMFILLTYSDAYMYVCVYLMDVYIHLM